MDAIYARQSVDKKDSISIETQIEFCRRELTDAEQGAVYSDKGYSGSNLQRPEFQQMLEDVKAGKINRIITYRLDRISRSVLDFANLIECFECYGVSFHSTQEKFDTSTPMGRAMLNITMVFAQLERETIQQRIRDNYYTRGEKGMYLGGPPPFGFGKTEFRTEQGRMKLLEPNPETAPTVARMFEVYGNELQTLGEIVRALNEEAVPSPNASIWDSSKLSRILRNPVYVKADVDVYQYYRKRGCLCTNELSDFTLGKGCYLYGKREGHGRKYTDVTGHTLSLAPHDGLVSSALFLRCQARLDQNTQIDNRKRSQLTWLTGLIKCGCCGYSVVPKSSNNGRYTYLYCSGKANTGRCDVEGNLGAPSAVESVVAERIFRWARSYRDLRANVEVAENKERGRLLVRMEEINAGIQKLIDLAVTSNELSGPYLNEKITQLETERRALEGELDHLDNRQNQVLRKEVADLEQEWDALDIRRKNAIASLLISRIQIQKDEIEIQWNYDFDF
ncbi:MAG: recombinase family protein [Lawsonibacter sp.]